jgi:putative addiction module component (TIGR02574 family)
VLTCYNRGMNYGTTMKPADIPEIRNMSVSEKLLLVEDLWNEIAGKSESLELPIWHGRELEKGIEGFKRNPREGSSWEDVKGRLESRE